MKNKKIKCMIVYRRSFVEAYNRCGNDYIVEVPMMHIRLVVDNPAIYFSRFCKVYVNRKRYLRREWKALRWVYDEV